MRILVTNDDGVYAPGLAAITRALARWANEAPAGEDREICVVAPLENYSGASAAVGTVFEREAVTYRSVAIDGAEHVPTYGIDGSPALSVLLSMLEGFGPAPDMVVSGINLGVNVGRSIMYSGTVGATLTAAQRGVSGLAVSIRSGIEPLHWTTAATTALAVLPILTAAPGGTVLNLNVPSVPLDELRGVRHGRAGTAGLIKAAERPPTPPPARTEGGPHDGGGGDGEIRLVLGAAVPSLGDVGDEDPEDDASLVAAGFASLTALVGVQEDTSPAAEELVGKAVADLDARFGGRA